MNIYEKLLNVQMELKAPKGQYNSFGKYKYRSCEDILESLKPVLNKFKLAIYISDDITEVNGRNYIKTTITLVNVEEPREFISNSALAREEETKKGMDGSQITGASSSYARKYALNGMFAIDDTKDSDSTNTHGKEELAEKDNFKETDETKAFKEKQLKTKKERAIKQIMELITDDLSQEKLEKSLSDYNVSTLGECNEYQLKAIYILLGGK